MVLNSGYVPSINYTIKTTKMRASTKIQRAAENKTLES